MGTLCLKKPEGICAVGGPQSGGSFPCILSEKTKGEEKAMSKLHVLYSYAPSLTGYCFQTESELDEHLNKLKGSASPFVSF